MNTKKIPANIVQYEESEEEVDIKYIISKKPKVSIVREFLKANLCTIKNKDDELFENNI